MDGPSRARSCSPGSSVGSVRLREGRISANMISGRRRNTEECQEARKNTEELELSCQEGRKKNEECQESRLKNVKNVKKTPRIEVSIASDGVDTVARFSLPDSGADVDIMSKDWAEDQGLILDKTDKVSFHAADNKSLEVEGSVQFEVC